MFLPSSLVARRADILSAAAAVTAANAQLGVTQAALFPVLTLSASGGYRAPSTAALFDMPSKVWSLGPSLAYAVFDGGLRQAQRRGAMANLEVQTAQYRQVVLTALQEVEDQLVATAQYAEQGRLQSEALTAADKALEVVNNQYLAGTASAQALITAQQTQLAAQVALLSARHQQALAVNVLLKNVAGAVAP
jgi:outer membrane protein TolC